ncbi:MAG TPA: amidohydrolase family protein [Pseudomonadales bacterium]
MRRGAGIAIGRSLLRGVVAGLAALAAPVAVSAAGIAVVGGTVHTLEGEAPLQDATVLVRDGRIAAVGAGLDVPAGYERVDARGKVVTPGLIAAHTQLGLVEISGEASTVDARVAIAAVDDLKEAYRLGPAFDVQYGINPQSTLLPVNRAGGITRAIVAPVPGNDPFSGWGAAIRLTDDDVLLRPRLALYGSIGAGSADFTGGSRAALIQRLRMGLAAAREFRPSRYEPEEGEYTRRELTALKEFLDSDRPLVLAVNRASEIEQSLALARDFGLRLVILGGAEAWRAADALAADRVPVIVDVLDNLPLSFDQLGARMDNAALLHEAGVPVVFTTEDSHNARLIRQVAGNAVAEGMPWPAALAAITRRPAEVFGLQPGTGTLAVGAPADLVIWTGDPLELTTWAERVMIDGQWMPMETRQSELLERYRDLDAPYGYR